MPRETKWLHIKDWSVELHRLIKSECGLRGITIREALVEGMQLWVDRERFTRAQAEKKRRKTG